MKPGGEHTTPKLRPNVRETNMTGGHLSKSRIPEAVVRLQVLTLSRITQFLEADLRISNASRIVLRNVTIVCM